MVKLWKLSAGILAVLALTGAALADNAPPRFYKLNFVIKEVEGARVLNARTYSIIVASGFSRGSSIRTGTKVPYQSTPQIQYVDLGVNIDCDNVHEVDGALVLAVASDLSSIPQEQLARVPPTIRQNKWSSVVVVSLGKPTVLFTSDDPASRQQMQLELTATPIR